MKFMFSYYSKLSTEVYDLDKPIGHSFGDVEFYKEALKDYKGKILEPAVGTGRILIPLLQEGLDVDGMDISDEMLSLCSLHCKDRDLKPNLYKKDMKNFSLPDKYEAVILPAGSFLLLDDRNESIDALKCFYKLLLPNGQLIIDIFLQTNFKVGSNSTKTWKVNDRDLITLEETLVKVDYVNQYSISYLKYEKWRDRKLIETELEELPLRWYGIEEFKLILKDIGFHNITISSDYKYGKYPSKKNEIITFQAYR